MTVDAGFTKLIGSIMSNRWLYVKLNEKKSRWRNQKNGLPQGSILSPVLFNVYTNDLPVHNEIRSFFYADDLCIATQRSTFEKTETILTVALQNLGEYYERIQNPFLTAQSTQIKSVISVPIKDFIHHYPRALFNDIPGSGRIFTTYPGRAQFNDIPRSGRSLTTYPGQL